MLIFGIHHCFGVPGCFLGWLLAKSIAEIEGTSWVWFIHFLLDVIRFTGLFLAAPEDICCVRR